MTLKLLEKLLRYEFTALSCYHKLAKKYPIFKDIANDELKHVKIVAEIIRLVASGRIESVVELIKKESINFILVDLINHKKMIEECLEHFQNNNTVFISFVTRNKGWNVRIIERSITSQGAHHFTSIFQIPLLLGDADTVIIDSVCAIEIIAGLEDARKFIYYLAQKSKEHNITLILFGIEDLISENLKRYIISLADNYVKII
ncbi:MAG TPA: ferritin-like domain-containing protein [Archaeoglobus profundus]|nr:ferritin-like domain-containing protein [Archaeoglobus profundus]